MFDPTREEMLAFFELPIANGEEFDVEEAIFWFANDYHGGQFTNLYAALSQSPFKPSPLSSGVEAGTTAGDLYMELEAHYVRKEF